MEQCFKSINGLIIFAMLPVASNMHLYVNTEPDERGTKIPDEILRRSEMARSMMEREPMFLAWFSASL